MNLIDTHAHLDMPPFEDPTERRFAAFRAAAAGISEIVIPAVGPATWDALLGAAEELRESAPCVRIHTALGIHPQVLSGLEPRDDAAALHALGGRIRAAPAGLVAIGECGLDFGPRGRGTPRDRQVAVLVAHFALARATGLPLLLHCVGAHAVLAGLLAEHRPPPSILHSYSGSAELVPVYCRGGHAFSFASAITLPGARRPGLAARAVPAERLLLETDCPDQSPAGRRPARGEPAFLVDVAQAVADARDEPVDVVAATTTANARRLLQLAA